MKGRRVRWEIGAAHCLADETGIGEFVSGIKAEKNRTGQNF